MTNVPVGGDKPLDFGNGALGGSVDAWGGVLAVGTGHERLGYAVLETSARFPDQLRHDVRAVRAYRRALAATDARGLGFTFDHRWSVVRRDLLAEVVPRITLAAGELTARVTTWAVRLDGRPLPLLAQVWQLRNGGDEPVCWDMRWGGTWRLGRAALTQLTEGGIVPDPDGELVVDYDGQSLTAVRHDLDLAAVVAGLPPAPPSHLVGDGALDVWLPARMTVPAGSERRVELLIGLAPSVADARAAMGALDDRELGPLITEDVARWRATLDPVGRRLPHDARRLTHRAVAYTLACCSLPVDDGLCLVTDHRILPLSWTRDAYYCVRMLCAAGVADPAGMTRRHLNWLFATCRRPGGAFARAYLPNGQPKDLAFQLDQQCYPLLELADHVTVTGDVRTVRQYARQIDDVLDAIHARRDDRLGLFATDETPGDDRLELPFHFSSHVVLWRTLRRLADLGDVIPGAGALTELAEALRNATMRQFTVARAGRRLFAYAVDGEGGHLVYHDANDLPTVLAPTWGFCRTDDPVWAATLDHAFSCDNVGGFYPGAFGGLGSVHTPGAWPLGDVQELIYARAVGDGQRAGTVLGRLQATACRDGSLPEARDPDTGRVRSRHWFAWPGAALAAALLEPTGATNP